MPIFPLSLEVSRHAPRHYSFVHSGEMASESLTSLQCKAASKHFCHPGGFTSFGRYPFEAPLRDYGQKQGSESVFVTNESFSSLEGTSNWKCRLIVPMTCPYLLAGGRPSIGLRDLTRATPNAGQVPMTHLHVLFAGQLRSLP